MTRPHKVLTLILLCTGSAGVPSVSRAEVVPRLELSSGYDDNLYRVPEDRPLGPDRSHSDALYRAKASIEAPVLLGNWTAEFSADASHTWHTRNSRLDFFGYSAGVDVGQKTSIWNLSLTAKSDRDLTPFSEVRTLERNIQTRHIAELDASRVILGNVRIAALARGVRSTHSLASLEANEVNRGTGALGIGYYSPTKSFVVLEYVATDARSPHLGQLVVNGDVTPYRNSYRETGAGFRLHWQFSAVTLLEGRVGYTKHDDRSALENDVQGITGHLLVRWRPRESITFDLRGVRDFQTENTLYSNGIRVSTAELSAQAAITAHWNIDADSSYQTRHFDSAARNLSGEASDHTRRYRVALEYAPQPRWGVSMMIEHTDRDARTQLGDYNGNTAWLTLFLTKATDALHE